MKRAWRFQLVVLASVAWAITPEGKAFQQHKQGQPEQVRLADSGPGRLDSAGVLRSRDEDYRIGPSDVIEIQVEDAPELSGSWRVSANGTFPMPYLGRLSAKDRTTDELEKTITDGLRGRYLKEPHVTVAVKQINSRAFFVQGSVRSPGVYYIEGRPSLLEVITMAGGLADNYGSLAFIIRRNKASGGLDPQANEKSEAHRPATSDEAEAEAAAANYDVKTVNINGLFKGRIDKNVLLEPGDFINVPPADVFFVAGEVNAPGSFQLKEGTTLRQAISLAQGTTFSSAKSRAQIFRDDASGKRQEIPIDVDAIMSGKQADVQILANDIIMVPNSRFKSVAGALLRALGVNSARLPMRY